MPQKKGAADAEDSGLSATFKVYAATDLKSYDGKTIIKEGDFIKTIKSIDKDTDDGDVPVWTSCQSDIIR